MGGARSIGPSIGPPFGPPFGPSIGPVGRQRPAVRYLPGGYSTNTHHALGWYGWYWKRRLVGKCGGTDGRESGDFQREPGYSSGGSSGGLSPSGPTPVHGNLGRTDRKESLGRKSPHQQPILRMSPDDEKLALNKGHFLNRLTEAGLVDESGEVTAKGNEYVERMNATYIHLTINKMLSMNKRYQTVLAVVRDVGPYIGAVNLATAMHRLGRLVRSARANNPQVLQQVVRHPQYTALLGMTEDFIELMEPRALANFLWGMAALGDQQNTGVVLRLGNRLMEIDPLELKTQEISNVVWSLATLEMQMPELMDRMLNAACDRIHECVPQALSNMIWACATLRHHNARFIGAVAESAAPRLDTFQSQTLANTLWAYSVLGVYPSELFSIAADEIVERLTKKEKAVASLKAHKLLKKPRMLQNNKAVKLKHGAKTLEREQRAYYEFRGQEISNVLIAYARGCIIHPQLLECLEEELCGSVTIEVASDGPGGTGKVMEQKKVDRLELFTSQALTNTLWAFATLRWYPARLLPCITHAMGKLVRRMTAQELANSLWSYARFAYHPGRVMWSFLAVMSLRIDEFEAQGCTNSLWALAVLKATHSPAFVKLLERYVALERTSVSFGELQYNQVLQAVLLAQFESRGGRVAWRPEVDLPEDVVDRALDAWASQQTSTQLSGFHLDVSEGLSRLGVSHRIEHLVARDLLSIDIAVVTEGRFIAIEVDGPFHFPVNARTPLGHTMIRRRLLRAAGWAVVPIPWYEWFEMKTWDDRLQYLASALAKADESLLGQLRVQGTVRDMLSTDFLPGPGGTSALGDGAKALSASSPRDTAKSSEVSSESDQEDGPVLAYSDTMYGSRPDDVGGVETGLMDALNRSNVQLTSGAIRRLKSMGLEGHVRDISSRRKKKKLKADESDDGAGATSAPSTSPTAPIDAPTSFNRSVNLSVDKPAKKARTAANATAPIVAPQPATRFNPKFVDDKAGWSPYWNASFVSSTDSTDSKDDESDASDAESGLLADANPMKTSDKLFKKVLHGRESAQIKDIKASDDDQRNDQHND